MQFCLLIFFIILSRGVSVDRNLLCICIFSSLFSGEFGDESWGLSSSLY
jgi:hypothetical protein